jgi:hypothetical protein
MAFDLLRPSFKRGYITRPCTLTASFGITFKKGGLGKRLDSLNKKNQYSEPSKLRSKCFYFALKDSADAFVLRLSK